MIVTLKLMYFPLFLGGFKGFFSNVGRNNVQHQHDNEMKPAYNGTIDAFHSTETIKEYMELGEPPYINTNARGLV